MLGADKAVRLETSGEEGVDKTLGLGVVEALESHLELVPVRS